MRIGNSYRSSRYRRSSSTFSTSSLLTTASTTIPLFLLFHSICHDYVALLSTTITASLSSSSNHFNSSPIKKDQIQNVPFFTFIQPVAASDSPFASSSSSEVFYDSFDGKFTYSYFSILCQIRGYIAAR